MAKYCPSIHPTMHLDDILVKCSMLFIFMNIQKLIRYDYKTKMVSEIKSSSWNVKTSVYIHIVKLNLEMIQWSPFILITILKCHLQNNFKIYQIQGVLYYHLGSVKYANNLSSFRCEICHFKAHYNNHICTRHKYST